MESLPCSAPASFVPYYAMAFTGADNQALAVKRASPLPVAPILAASASDPLAGASVASEIVGPFTPELGRPIWLTLSGTWSGRARLMRSTDEGVTITPLTIGGMKWAEFTGNANEAVVEESVAGATYHLEITLASGTLNYEVAQ